MLEKSIYSIPDLAQLLECMGHDQTNINNIKKILLESFNIGGDYKLIETYTEISGVEIQAIRRGRYMFANLCDPDKKIWHEKGM